MKFTSLTLGAKSLRAPLAPLPSRSALTTSTSAHRRTVSLCRTPVPRADAVAHARRPRNLSGAAPPIWNVQGYGVWHKLALRLGINPVTAVPICVPRLGS
jgi:hypothetical protein